MDAEKLAHELRARIKLETDAASEPPGNVARKAFDKIADEFLRQQPPVVVTAYFPDGAVLPSYIDVGSGMLMKRMRAIAKRNVQLDHSMLNEASADERAEKAELTRQGQVMQGLKYEPEVQENQQGKEERAARTRLSSEFLAGVSPGETLDDKRSRALSLSRDLSKELVGPMERKPVVRWLPDFTPVIDFVRHPRSAKV